MRNLVINQLLLLIHLLRDVALAGAWRLIACDAVLRRAGAVVHVHLDLLGGDWLARLHRIRFVSLVGTHDLFVSRW